MTAETVDGGLPYVSTDEAARLLGVTARELREQRAAGTAPAATKVAGRWMFQADEVRAHAALRAWGEPAYRVIAPAGLPRHEWLDVRSRGLGGSDGAAALGMDPWRSPWQLWAEKTGRWDEDDAGEAAEHGTGLEPYVASLFARRHPELILTRSPGVLAHRDHPWLLANPDRLAVDPVTRKAIVVELKAPGLRMAHEWVGEEAPARYIVQVQLYLAVTGAAMGYFGALIGGQTYVEKPVYRDDALIDLLIEQLGDWWQRHVVADEQPDMDGAERTASLLGRLYTVDENSVAELPAEVDDLLADLAKVKAREQELGEERRQLENKLRELMGPVEVGLRDGQIACTWKRNGAFAHAKFAKAEPELAAQYRTSKPAIDAKALERDHPDIYGQYRARVLHPKEL